MLLDSTVQPLHPDDVGSREPVSMELRDDLAEALERARETVRATKAIAEHMNGKGLRDVLLLEVLALQAVIDRIEVSKALMPSDVLELEANTDRVTNVVGTNFGSESSSIH